MKTMKYYAYRVIAIVALSLAFAIPSKAQMSDNYYANIDWQFSFPLGIDFADKASGWGMNFEGGYFITENFSIGAFLAYHSNHKYIPRQDIILSEGATYVAQGFTLMCVIQLNPSESYLSFFPRLQRSHKVRRFEGMVLPPLDTGRMWST